jgi:hypothetical protein
MLGDVDEDELATTSLYASGGPGMYVGPRRVMGPSSMIAEVAFFTEIPQMETVRCGRVAVAATLGALARGTAAVHARLFAASAHTRTHTHAHAQLTFCRPPSVGTARPRRRPCR